MAQWVRESKKVLSCHFRIFSWAWTQKYLRLTTWRKPLNLVGVGREQRLALGRIWSACLYSEVRRQRNLRNVILFETSTSTDWDQLDCNGQARFRLVPTDESMQRRITNVSVQYGPTRTNDGYANKACSWPKWANDKYGTKVDEWPIQASDIIDNKAGADQNEKVTITSIERVVEQFGRINITSIKRVMTEFKKWR